MNRYFTKNAYSPINRTQYIGAQRGPRRPNRRVRRQEGRKCRECGTVLSKQRGYVIDRINQNRLCLRCYRTTRRKKGSAGRKPK